MTSLDEICCARIPAASLAGLAEIRCADGVEVIADEEAYWVQWPAGSDDVLRLVLPLPGVVLYVQRAGQWYTFGSRLPCSGPPDSSSQWLDRLLTPERTEPEPSPLAALHPALLRLVRDEKPRTTSAMRCSLAAFAAWAEGATTVRLTSLRAALAADVILLIGEHLPLLPDSLRFWGKRVLVPLGWRPEPALPESALVSVLRLEGDDVAVLTQEGVDIVPATAWCPVNRPSVRLACRERTP